MSYSLKLSQGKKRELISRFRLQITKCNPDFIGENIIKFLEFADDIFGKAFISDENFLQLVNVMIMGGFEPSVFADEISKFNDKNHSHLCGLIWNTNFLAYRCKTCALSPCMSICPSCFKNGPHEKESHDYHMFRSQAGGACDCGDGNVMKSAGFCTKHTKVANPENQHTLLLPICSEEYTVMFECIAPYVVGKLLAFYREYCQPSGELALDIDIPACYPYIETILQNTVCHLGQTLFKRILIQALLDPEIFHFFIHGCPLHEHDNLPKIDRSADNQSAYFCGSDIKTADPDNNVNGSRDENFTKLHKLISDVRTEISTFPPPILRIKGSKEISKNEPCLLDKNNIMSSPMISEKGGFCLTKISIFTPQLFQETQTKYEQACKLIGTDSQGLQMCKLLDVPNTRMVEISSAFKHGNMLDELVMWLFHSEFPQPLVTLLLSLLNVESFGTNNFAQNQNTASNNTFLKWSCPRYTQLLSSENDLDKFLLISNLNNESGNHRLTWDYKKAFGLAFVKHYACLPRILMRSADPEGVSSRLFHISVQLFSNEQLSYEMVKGPTQLILLSLNSLNLLILPILVACQLKKGTQLMVIDCGHRIMQSHSYWPIVSDLITLLSHKSISDWFLDSCEENNFSTTNENYNFTNNNNVIWIWTHILYYFQGTNANKRQLETHLEYEPRTFYVSFAAEIEMCLTPLLALLSHYDTKEVTLSTENTCGDKNETFSLAKFMNLLHHVLLILTDWLENLDCLPDDLNLETMPKILQGKGLTQSNFHNDNICDSYSDTDNDFETIKHKNTNHTNVVCISDNIFSFHIPLHRYLAHILITVCFKQNTSNGKNNVNNMSEPNHILTYLTRHCPPKTHIKTYLKALLLHPLTIQVALSEIHGGLWVRNGTQIRTQALAYQQTTLLSTMFWPDIFLIQLMASFLPANEFTEYVISSYGISNANDMLAMQTNTQITENGTYNRIQGFLILTLGLISYRDFMDINELVSIEYGLVTLLVKKTSEFYSNLTTSTSNKNYNINANADQYSEEFEKFNENNFYNDNNGFNINFAKFSETCVNRSQIQELIPDKSSYRIAQSPHLLAEFETLISKITHYHSPRPCKALGNTGPSTISQGFYTPKDIVWQNMFDPLRLLLVDSSTTDYQISMINFHQYLQYKQKSRHDARELKLIWPPFRSIFHNINNENGVNNDMLKHFNAVLPHLLYTQQMNALLVNILIDYLINESRIPDLILQLALYVIWCKIEYILLNQSENTILKDEKLDSKSVSLQNYFDNDTLKVITLNPVRWTPSKFSEFFFEDISIHFKTNHNNMNDYKKLETILKQKYNSTQNLPNTLCVYELLRMAKSQYITTNYLNHDNYCITYDNERIGNGEFWFNKILQSLQSISPTSFMHDLILNKNVQEPTLILDNLTQKPKLLSEKKKMANERQKRILTRYAKQQKKFVKHLQNEQIDDNTQYIPSNLNEETCCVCSQFITHCNIKLEKFDDNITTKIVTNTNNNDLSEKLEFLGGYVAYSHESNVLGNMSNPFISRLPLTPSQVDLNSSNFTTTTESNIVIKNKYKNKTHNQIDNLDSIRLKNNDESLEHSMKRQIEAQLKLCEFEISKKSLNMQNSNTTLTTEYTTENCFENVLTHEILQTLHKLIMENDFENSEHTLARFKAFTEFCNRNLITSIESDNSMANTDAPNAKIVPLKCDSWSKYGRFFTCRHIIHYTCYETYKKTVQESNLSPLQSGIGEFFCPVCRSPSNTFIPLVQLTSNCEPNHMSSPFGDEEAGDTQNPVDIAYKNRLNDKNNETKNDFSEDILLFDQTSNNFVKANTGYMSKCLMLNDKYLHSHSESNSLLTLQRHFLQYANMNFNNNISIINEKSTGVDGENVWIEAIRFISYIRINLEADLMLERSKLEYHFNNIKMDLPDKTPRKKHKQSVLELQFTNAYIHTLRLANKCHTNFYALMEKIKQAILSLLTYETINDTKKSVHGIPSPFYSSIIWSDCITLFLLLIFTNWPSMQSLTQTFNDSLYAWISNLFYLQLSQLLCHISLPLKMGPIQIYENVKISGDNRNFLHSTILYRMQHYLNMCLTVLYQFNLLEKMQYTNMLLDINMIIKQRHPLNINDSIRSLNVRFFSVLQTLKIIKNTNYPENLYENINDNMDRDIFILIDSSHINHYTSLLLAEKIDINKHQTLKLHWIQQEWFMQSLYPNYANSKVPLNNHVVDNPSTSLTLNISNQLSREEINTCCFWLHSLILIPETYETLFSTFFQRKCLTCQTKPRDPAVCLVCGTLICVRDNCCTQINTQNSPSNTIYEACKHADMCGYGTAVYLIINSGCVLIIHAHRACIWSSLYLDSYGEEDRDLRRGKPLYLNSQRLAYIETLYKTDDFLNTLKQWTWHMNSL